MSTSFAFLHLLVAHIIRKFQNFFFFSFCQMTKWISVKLGNKQRKKIFSIFSLDSIKGKKSSNVFFFFFEQSLSINLYSLPSSLFFIFGCLDVATKCNDAIDDLNSKKKNGSAIENWKFEWRIIKKMKWKKNLKHDFT